MILFYDDWDKYPGAIADTKTTNSTFLRQAGLYKSMGIKNHSFILALMDPKLQGVDPHSPTLSQEQILRITVECKRNYWYYLREVARVPPPVGTEPLVFRAHRGNIAAAWLFHNHVTYVLIQIRQTGKSVQSDILTKWLTNIRCTNTEINLLTKDSGLRVKNMERLRRMEKLLPPYFQLMTKNDTDNTEAYSVNLLGNTFKAHVPRTSPGDAQKVGRGFTSPIYLNDEGPFQPNVRISTIAALGAGGDAREKARELGEPYGTIFTTTAGSLTDESGRYIYSLIQNSAVWTEKFFDCKDQEQLEDRIMKAGHGKVRVSVVLNHRQLGHTDEWLKRKILEVEDEGDSPEDVEADWTNRWKTGGLKLPFDKQLGDRIHKSKREPEFTELSEHGYITRWYVPEHEVQSGLSKYFIVLAIDTSDAVGKDDIAMVARDLYSGKVLGAGDYNETNLAKFSEWVFTWFTRFKNMVAIPERKLNGGMLIDYLATRMLDSGMNPFERIFNWVVDEAGQHPDRMENITQSKSMLPQIYEKYRKHFGYATSGAGKSSRDKLFGSTLGAAAKYTCDVVYDIKLADQILSLTERNGRLDHKAGGHDDLCVGWLLSYWLITNGRNLKYYGIDTRRVLESAIVRKEKPSLVDLFEEKRQAEIRVRINEISAQLSEENDEFAIFKLEKELRTLSEKLVLSSKEVFNVDSLIKELEMTRKANKW